MPVRRLAPAIVLLALGLGTVFSQQGLARVAGVLFLLAGVGGVYVAFRYPSDDDE